jgi:inosine/xanthosine triphosphate pyrophosphatase family protein
MIVEKPEVEIEHGIPISSVFKPDGHSKVYSAFTKTELIAISHRGKAVRKCHDFLMDLKAKD